MNLTVEVDQDRLPVNIRAGSFDGVADALRISGMGTQEQNNDQSDSLDGQSQWIVQHVLNMSAHGLPPCITKAARYGRLYLNGAVITV